MLILAVSLNCSGEEESASIEERAKTIHEKVITMDTHVDINTQNFTSDNNYTEDLRDRKSVV